MTETSDIHEVYPERVAVVGVKVRGLGESKTTRTNDVSLKVGDYVILELDNDETFGVVTSTPYILPFTPPMRMMKEVLRKATEEDRQCIARHETLVREGWAFCLERVSALGLQMKLVEVYGALRRRLLTFTYTADDRVDFRQLVKDLARRFGCRIEMRHISTRDEARRLSGVDTCGLILCCATFLTDFKPVLPKNRKGDPAIVDPHRIGVCGRIKCCLLFEEADWTATPRPSSPLIHPNRRRANSTRER
ncbi:MAG: hypothetical protein D6690_08730 [Nitrospirae bacterium]|nr:MAG: hypothetical protein D6690_08730 [Nitrospirota bacterium]